jgi:hypothetical protein
LGPELKRSTAALVRPNSVAEKSRRLEIPDVEALAGTSALRDH